MYHLETRQFTEAERGGVYLATGSSHPQFAEDVATNLGTQLDGIERSVYPNGEIYIRFEDSVRKKHAFLMQSHVTGSEHSINDSTQELIQMADAARRASADEITAVIPLLGYARQDRQTNGRESIAAAIAIRQLVAVGVRRFVTVDMHSHQTQAVHEGPFDHLAAEPYFYDRLQEIVHGKGHKFKVIAPDAGRTKVDEKLSYKLGAGFDMLIKVRNPDAPDGIVRPKKPKAVKDKTCIIVDDMIDTAGTLVTAANSLYEAGAKRVIAAATHGIFSEPALERLRKSKISRIIVTDTVPQEAAQSILGDRLEVISMAPLVARAIFEIATGGSLSPLFPEGQNYS